MIVVEGPDGAGKTSLIKQLKKEFGFSIASRVVSKDTEAMVDLREWVDRNLDQGFQEVIFDRYRLISETIYGPILRKKQHEGFTELKWLGPRMQRFYQLKPIIIYCLPPLEVVKANVLDDEDNVKVADSIEQVYAAYVSRIALDHAYAPGMIKVWDYTKSLKIDELPALLFDVRRELNMRRKQDD